MNTHETILAIASSPGRSGRGILRFSGASTFDLLARILEFDGDLPSRGSWCSRLHLPGFDLPCHVLLFRGPNSYTGEDSAELQVAGNPLLLDRIIESMLEVAKRCNLDLRRAEPGEYTARAFLNGKMNLIEAEGVAATIAAQSDAQLRAAKMLSSGELSNLAHDLADELAGALALVEAGIDFTDQEDVVAIAPDELARRLNELRRRITHQLKRSVGMEQFEEIPWVVFCGSPNAGKSTLFNALLGRERAVVSPIRGTTRDVLVEPLTIETFHGKAEVMLVDLAGDDVQDTILHQRMQTMASEALRRAELILHCVPAGEVKPDVRGHEIVVTTKADLLQDSIPLGLVVSAKDGLGLEALQRLITDRLADRAVSLDADLMVLQARHESALRAANAHLEEAVICIAPEVKQRHLSMPEVVAASMRGALDELAALAGDITPDEILGRVFATFCVGK